MENFSRRSALKGIGASMLLPVLLKADGEIDRQSAVGKYELAKTKDGGLSVKSDKEQVRFRVGTSALMLRPKSEVSFETDGLGIKVLRLVTGGVMGVFAEGDKKIITKTFAAGIRGTGIYLEEHKCDENYICLCYGKADYISPNGKVFTSLTSKHHDKPFLITGHKDGSVEFTNNKTQNHTDDELRALEKMCKRVVPFDSKNA